MHARAPPPPPQALPHIARCPLLPQIDTARGRAMAESYGMQFFETSAKDGTNVTTSFAAIARVAAEAQLLAGAAPGGGASSGAGRSGGAAAGAKDGAGKKECTVM